MIKVTQVITSLNPTGPLKVIEEIINKKKKDITFQIIVIGGKAKKEISIPKNTNLIYTNSRYNVFKILYAFLKNDTHILHCHGLRSIFFVAIYNFFFLFKKKNISVCTSHSDIFTEFPIQYGPTKGKILLIIYKYLLCNLDLIICVSNSIKQKLELNYKIKNTKVIQNGVKIKDKKIKIFNNYYNFISVGHLSNLKNITFLINIFETLDDKFKLHVYGSGKKKLNLKLKKCKNIIFHGFKDNLDAMYNSSHCLITASKSEGTPLSVLEAVSSGCLIFLSNIPAHQEIIENLNLPNKYLFNLDDSNDLIDKIKSIDKFYDEKFHLAIAKSRFFYNSEIMSDNYCLMYKELINEKFKK